MHGFSTESALLVNAEVDSMGGFVEGGVGVGNKTSPRRAAIEKVQAEIRQEHEVIEKRRRELEFLQKGGDPLDFKHGNAASLSIQSTSLTDQIVTSDAKGSFAHGDSVESSDRPGIAPICEPNSADNLMLFDNENECKNLANNSRTSSQSDINKNTNELQDSATFSLPKKAYKRRSRPNRDNVRTGLVDSVTARGGHSASLSSRVVIKGAKPLVSGSEIQKDPSISKSTPTSPIKGTDSVNLVPSELDRVKAVESIDEGLLVLAPNANISEKSATGIVESFDERKDVDFTGQECEPSKSIEKVEGQTSVCQINGFSNLKGDRKSLDIESSCKQTSFSLDGNKDNTQIHPDLKNADSNGTKIDVTLMTEETLVKEKASKSVIEKTEIQPLIVNECNSIHQENGFIAVSREELKRNILGSDNDSMDLIVAEKTQSDGDAKSNTNKKDEISDTKKEDIPKTLTITAPIITNEVSIKSSIQEIPEATALIKYSVPVVEEQGNNVEVKSKADEDSILEEARIIEAKRKRISELSVAKLSSEYRKKSQWDYVLEEMAWLANDFAQERLWKITAAATICHKAVFSSRRRFEKQRFQREQKSVSHVLSKAVMEFWHSIEDASKMKAEIDPKKDSVVPIREYAMRFLESNSSKILHMQAESPEIISGSEIIDMTWEDHWTEESLFYTVPSDAMGAYRKLVESQMAKYEKTGSSVQDEVETSACNAVTEFGSQNNVYEEEGETSTYSRFAGQRKRKIVTNAYGVRQYEVGANSVYTQCMDNKATGSQQLGKRAGTSLNVPIPIKRIRTASRQRVLTPFTAGTSESVQFPNKMDASSGDNSPFRDDHITLHGGSSSHIPNTLEVNSVREYGKQLPFDSLEVSKPKKKKKQKHMVSSYEQRWTVDPHFQNEQKDHSRKRLESQQIESNGLFGQHVSKKLKMIRPMHDTTFENISPAVGGSVPAPVATQMSNMSNPNKLIKILGGRDRGRKTKLSKVQAAQQGLGSPWSLFEDQALVVLVHDMGPNWELVSDAINSTLQFKCIYRNPNDCKERHKILMDRTSGDGGDSAEDSGSSQPYNSTLPGIPKGTARHLFQRLQGPMEEDTLKSHFEKMIMIELKHRRKFQNHDAKHIQQPHSSHMACLAQVSPNNLNGPVLTPLDLCDSSASPSPEIVSLGYHSPHNSGLAAAMPNQSGALSPTLPTASGGNPALQGGSTTSMVVSSPSLSPSLSPSPSTLNNSVRDGGRYGGVPPRAGGMEEQQRMQQYNQMISARNMAPGGVRSGNGMNRMVRPGMLANPGMRGHMMRPMMGGGEQVSQTNTQTGVGVGSSNLPAVSSSSYQQMHMLGPPHLQGANAAQHQAYAIRLAKERQRYLQQQQQQQHFAAAGTAAASSGAPPSTPMPPHVQQQPPPMTSSQTSLGGGPKLQMTSHVRNSLSQTGGTANQMPKQRRQPQPQFQQAAAAARHNLQQQRQQPQTKLVKGGVGVGVGRSVQHSVPPVIPNPQPQSSDTVKNSTPTPTPNLPNNSQEPRPKLLNQNPPTTIQTNRVLNTEKTQLKESQATTATSSVPSSASQLYASPPTANKETNPTIEGKKQIPSDEHQVNATPASDGNNTLYVKPGDSKPEEE